MLKLLALDRFTILLFVMVLLASLWPISGQAAEYFSVLTTSAIALLFFLHGAKLSRDAIREGLFHWKLHSIISCLLLLCFRDWGSWLDRSWNLYWGKCCIGVFYFYASCPQPCSPPSRLPLWHKAMSLEPSVVPLFPTLLVC